MVKPMLKVKFRPFYSKISLNAPVISFSNEAMEDPPIKHGYLCTPPQGKLLKRTWQKKYYALYKASNYGVERVEVFDNEDSFLQHSSSRKIIPLNDCVKVVQAPQKHQQNVFDVITKSQMYQFSADTTQELSEWLQAFQMVAFGGGQRRDLGPSTPPPSSYSSGHSQTSSSSSVNAEEENQIYSSFNGPEVHLVRVVETEASVACNLQGTYLLVVSPIQLFLLEEGMSVNGKKYLFAWPYRHIRRYGRNKNTFTFEAGRKCTSGAGTFVFNTNDANAIFLSVQAYTRTLKREEEDAAMLTPSIIMNRTAQSWPSVEDVNLKSTNAVSSIHQASVPSDVASLGVSKSDVKDNIFERVLSRGKVLPPFAKPPRKIKLPGTPSNTDEKPASEPIRFELSLAARAKLSKSSSSNTIGVTPQDLYEPTYAEPEVRQEAWKVFGMESDNFHKEKMPDVGPYDEDGAMYASIAVSPTSPSSVLPWSPTKKEVPKILTALKRPTDSGCYDHLSQFVQQSPQPAVISDGHIYTRLVSVSTMETLQTTSNSQCSSLELAVNENHHNGTTNNKAALSDSQPVQQDDSEDIKRFLQNDEIYTVVAKPFKKFNAKSDDL